jgi:hypothetical protein
MTAAQQPATTSEVYASGAGICWIPMLRKFAVVDSKGHLHGYRNSLDEARALAEGLPARAPKPEPAAIPRSPHALPLAPTTYLPAGPRPDELPFRERGVDVVRSDAFARSRALSRRQAAAHDQVYGRHMRRGR